MDNNDRQKSDVRRRGENGDIEPVHGMTYCRRKASRSQRMFLAKARPDEMPINDRDNGNTVFTKSKSKCHLRKEIDRLMEENRILMAKLEHFQQDVTIDINEERKEKDHLILKIRNKYCKLHKEYEKVQQECEKLSVLLQQREFEYRQLHAHHEESTQVLQELEKTKTNLSKVNQKQISENIELNEDVMLMKKVIYQLNAELERYQDKLKSLGHNISLKKDSNLFNAAGTLEESKKMLEAWNNIDMHALKPLLDAYQENVIEKNDLITKYEQELGNFTSKCKEIISENESMQKEVEDLKSKCNRYMEEIREISEDATLIKGQNDLLIKQNAYQKQKIQEINLLYEQKVKSLSHDNQNLQKEYTTSKAELNDLQRKYKILNEGYEMLKSNSERMMPINAHTTAVEECKRLFEELKCQYESEKKKLYDRIKQFEETQPDNEKQLIIVTAEKSHLKGLVKSLEKKLTYTQHKLEPLQNTVYSMQISRDSFKRQLQKTTIYCEELVSEYEKVVAERKKLIVLLNEREKENADIQYLGDSIAHRVGNLRTQLHAVQKDAKDQLAMVEKHIKVQEEGVNQIKAEHQNELHRLKRLLKQKENIIVQLQNEKREPEDNQQLTRKVRVNNNEIK